MCIMRPAEKAAAWKLVTFPSSPVTLSDSAGNTLRGLQPEQTLLCPLTGTNVIICSLEQSVSSHFLVPALYQVLGWVLGHIGASDMIPALRGFTLGVPGWETEFSPVVEGSLETLSHSMSQGRLPAGVMNRMGLDG